MALAHATSVLTQAAIAYPMERLCPAPGFPHRVSAPDGITGERGQAPARLDRDRPAHVAVGLDHTPTGAMGPRALHASALAIRRAPIVACFQATVISVRGRMRRRGDGGQPIRFAVLAPEVNAVDLRHSFMGAYSIEAFLY